MSQKPTETPSALAYLLLLPAFVLLVAFTHYPAVATLIDSFFSTPKGARPARWVGLEKLSISVAIAG